MYLQNVIDLPTLTKIKKKQTEKEQLCVLSPLRIRQEGHILVKNYSDKF